MGGREGGAYLGGRGSGEEDLLHGLLLLELFVCEYVD